MTRELAAPHARSVDPLYPLYMSYAAKLSHASHACMMGTVDPSHPAAIRSGGVASVLASFAYGRMLLQALMHFQKPGGLADDGGIPLSPFQFALDDWTMSAPRGVVEAGGMRLEHLECVVVVAGSLSGASTSRLVWRMFLELGADDQNAAIHLLALHASQLLAMLAANFDAPSVASPTHPQLGIHYRTTAAVGNTCNLMFQMLPDDARPLHGGAASDYRSACRSACRSARRSARRARSVPGVQRRAVGCRSGVRSQGGAHRGQRAASRLGGQV